jgi:hypothetical protein
MWATISASQQLATTKGILCEKDTAMEFFVWDFIYILIEYHTAKLPKRCDWRWFPFTIL